MADSALAAAAAKRWDERGPPARPRFLASLWEQYRRTLMGTQVIIAVVSLVALAQSHRLLAAFGFFAVMQAGAVVGAVWALSLKSRIEHARSTFRA
jgi:hypothetical protein